MVALARLFVSHRARHAPRPRRRLTGSALHLYAVLGFAFLFWFFPYATARHHPGRRSRRPHLGVFCPLDRGIFKARRIRGSHLSARRLAYAASHRTSAFFGQKLGLAIDFRRSHDVFVALPEP